MKRISELRPGDPVECCGLINLNPPDLWREPQDETLIEEQWIPGTVVYVDAHSIGVGFSDGERRAYERKSGQVRSAR